MSDFAPVAQRLRAILDGASPELLKRMQGKSCFNFRTVDEVLLRELEELTARGYRRYEADHPG